MQVNILSPKDIFRYAKNNRDSEITFKLLKDGKLFKDVIDTQVGQGILADAINEMGGLETRILNKKASDDEHALYFAYRYIIGKWHTRLESYNKTLNKVKENRNGKRKPR